MDPKFQADLDEINRLALQIQKEVNEMKTAFPRFNKLSRPTVEELIKEGHKWEAWYAWRPVRDIHGQWHWRKDIYRILGNTYVDQEDFNWYHYGTVFDVIKTA